MSLTEAVPTERGYALRAGAQHDSLRQLQQQRPQWRQRSDGNEPEGIDLESGNGRRGEIDHGIGCFGVITRMVGTLDGQTAICEEGPCETTRVPRSVHRS